MFFLALHISALILGFPIHLHLDSFEMFFPHVMHHFILSKYFHQSVGCSSDDLWIFQSELNIVSKGFLTTNF